MAFTIEYKGLSLEFDEIPTSEALEARYQERVERLSAKRVSAEGEQGILEGPAPLAPIQRWFFEQNFARPSYWNHGILWTPARPRPPEVWKQAWRAILRHHDALRFRYALRQGEWVQSYGAMPEEVPFELVDLAAYEGQALDDARDRVLEDAHASLDLGAGPIARMVYLKLASPQPDQIFIVVHHLGIGGHAWTILAGDLQQAAEQIARDGQASLSPKTTSYRQWTRHLEQWDLQPEDVAYWTAESFDEARFDVPLDDDSRVGDSGTEGEARSVRCELEPAATRQLLNHEVDTKVILQAALGEALWTWGEHPVVAVNVEGNARDEFKREPAVNLSRTVGWFNTLYPIVLRRPQATDAREALAEMERQLACVPHDATIAYQAARRRAGDEPWRSKLSSRRSSDVLFNFYGLLQRDDARDAMRRLGSMRAPQNRRTHVLEIYTYHDSNRLFCDWIYSPSLHRQNTIAKIADDFLKSVRRLSCT